MGFKDKKVVNDLKHRLVNRLKQAGAYDVRIADPYIGYEHTKPGKHPDTIWEPLSPATLRKHPLELWDKCNSVIVFAVACPPKTNNTYFGPYAPWKGNRNVGSIPKNIVSDENAMIRLVDLLISQITLRGMQFLEENEYDFSVQHSSSSLTNLKISAYEAGIGVYGRAGFLIHPILGNRMNLGGILTDAVLEPDGHLENFNPCENCDLCIKMCPAQAFDSTKSYPYSYNRTKCMEKRVEITNKGLYCHNCYAVCPAGKLEDERLLRILEAKSIYQPRRT